MQERSMTQLKFPHEFFPEPSVARKIGGHSVPYTPPHTPSVQ